MISVWFARVMFAVIVAAAPREQEDPVPAPPASPVAARSHDMDPVNLQRATLRPDDEGAHTSH